MQKIDINLIKKAGNINRLAIKIATDAISPGITPLELDKLIHAYIESQGGTPAFLGYRGYPNASCISVNSNIVHAIPSNTPIKDGDVLTIDCGTQLEGMYVDSAVMIGVGEISQDADKLLNGTMACLEAACSILRPGISLFDIATMCQKTARDNGINIFPQYTGHGIGNALHIPPVIFHTTSQLDGLTRSYIKRYLLQENQLICIEPITTIGVTSYPIRQKDGWTDVSKDGAITGHAEHTVLITDNGYEVIC